MYAGIKHLAMREILSTARVGPLKLKPEVVSPVIVNLRMHATSWPCAGAPDFRGPKVRAPCGPSSTLLLQEQYGRPTSSIGILDIMA